MVGLTFFRCVLFVNKNKLRQYSCKQRDERTTRNGCITGHRIRRLGAHVPVAGARAHPPRQVLLRQKPPLLTAELDRGSRWSGWLWLPNLTQLVQQHFLSVVVVAVTAAPAAIRVEVT